MNVMTMHAISWEVRKGGMEYGMVWYGMVWYDSWKIKEGN